MADEWNEPHDETPLEDDDARTSSSAPRSSVPPQLQNWRVTEVEGTAYPISDETRRISNMEGADTSSTPSHASVDHLDDLIVLTVPDRHVTIAPGASSTISLSLLNNSDRHQILEVAVQGGALPAWFPELPMRVPLHAGERQSVVLLIMPPLGAMIPAGDHAFRITARFVDQPNRYSRLAGTVTVERHTDFLLGALQPERVATSWWSPSAQTVLPVANLGNHETSFRIAGADAGRECLFEFDVPRNAYAQVGQASFLLGPGERSSVGVTILSKRRPVVGFLSQERLFHVVVELTGVAGRHNSQMANGRLAIKPLVGPWQIAGLAAVAAMALLMIMTSSAVMLLTLRTGTSQPTPAAVPTVPPAPAFALVLSMDEPVPTREADGPPPVAVAPESAAEAVDAPAPVFAADGLPVVQSDQVTAPGESVSVAPAADRAQPTPVAVQPVDPNNMTYAQMFQQIASRYDLNWRMLAAQGYVESGFDSTAVGRQGSLGIMQIHPSTWTEWAPHVDASDPFDTYGNVLVAAIYLDYLRTTLGRQGHPQVEWMLAAYNWGPDKVLDLLVGGGEWTDLPEEVQRYATDVLRIAQSIPEN